MEGRYEGVINSETISENWSSHTSEVGAVDRVDRPIVAGDSSEGLAIAGGDEACEMRLPMARDLACRLLRHPACRASNAGGIWRLLIALDQEKRRVAGSDHLAPREARSLTRRQICTAACNLK